MIKPEYLEAAAALIEVYYSNLQETLLRDIVGRLLHTNFAVSGTTAWRMEKLQEAGLLYDEAIKRIAEATGKSEKELKKLFEDAGVEVLDYGDGIYAALGIQPLSVRSSPELLRVLADGYKNTKGTMRNLTNTTAIDVKGTFIFACDMAYKAITSGAFSYGEAIANAVEAAAKIGAYVRYPTGHRDRVDVAARRAVLSGLGKTVGRLSEMACDELACDLVEVTAHFNARPSHAEWQGMVYSRSGKSKTYPDFSVCSYGTGAGLMGWNCYHSFHPFFEGISKRAYTDAELREMRENSVTYNGEALSGYEATQKQRAIERKIRESKRKLIAFDEGIKQTKGAEKGEFQMRYAFEGKQLSKLNAELDDFCRQTGMQKQYDRSRVLGFGRNEAETRRIGITKSAKTIDNSAKSGIIKSKEVKPVQSGAFYGALNPESDKDFERCQQHAERFYAAVRKRKTDIDAIAKNTGFDTEKVGKIKEHIFLNKYDLGEEEPTTFYPNYDIAVSWQNLMSGKDIEPKDIILLEHEYYEYKLMNEKGMSYIEAHTIAQEKYNYQKAVMDWRK